MNSPRDTSVNLEDLSSCSFDRTMLDATYIWLNDSEVLSLIDAEPVDRTAQLKWFDSLPERHDFMINGIKYKNNLIGVFGLKHIVDGTGEYWGYIGEKKYWGKGIGSWMMSQAMQMVITRNLSSIYLKVLGTNIRAISLYSKSGFQVDEAESDINTLVMKKVVL